MYVASVVLCLLSGSTNAIHFEHLRPFAMCSKMIIEIFKKTIHEEVKTNLSL